MKSQNLELKEKLKEMEQQLQKIETERNRENEMQKLRFE
jgi:hypothetical protein